MRTTTQSRNNFTAGSMQSSYSSVSMPELPNLPGVRRDISLINPKLYKEFKASQAASLNGSNDEFIDEAIHLVEEENSLMSYFERSNKMQGFSQILSPYPSASRAYNDISSGRYSLVSQQQDRLKKCRSLPYTNLSSLPSSISKIGQVCNFVAYFNEIPRDGIEDRSRKVILKLYLEDSSIEITEPRVENSGTTQGKFLKRHQIYKPNSTEIYTIEDMISGAEIIIYNRVYKIIDADLHTKRYMESMNIFFGYSLPEPSNMYDPTTRPGVSRAATRTTSRPPGGVVDYFKYNTKVLRFYGVWDSRSILFGDEINVKIHYSLAENTIEVVPIHSRNSGRDRLPKLLKKTQIMKKPLNMLPDSNSSTVDFDNLSYTDENESTASPINSPTHNIESDQGGIRSPSSRMNTVGTLRTNTAHTAATANSRTGITTTDSTQHLVPSQPYHWTDLKIGLVIPVASMTVLIIDADEFTREFYQSKMMPLDKPITRPLPEYPTLNETIPPYNGFGSEEDSLQTCKHTLIPSAPTKDGAKLKALANMIMRYEAVLAEPGPTDADRKFIIQVHLEDDTFQIREPPIRNSGHKGGIFLSRVKLESHDGSKPLTPKDLYLGGTVKILSHQFKIYNCDQFTFKYMEENANDWKYSNIKNLLFKIKPKREVIQRLILTYPSLATCFINTDELGELLEKAGLQLVKQEVCTLFRQVDVSRIGSIKLTVFLKYLMDL